MSCRTKLHKYHLHKSVALKIHAAPTPDQHHGYHWKTYVINNTFPCKKICRCANHFFVFLLLKKVNAVVKALLRLAGLDEQKNSALPLLVVGHVRSGFATPFSIQSGWNYNRRSVSCDPSPSQQRNPFVSNVEPGAAFVGVEMLDKTERLMAW